MHVQASILLVIYQQVQGKDPVDDGPGNNSDDKSTCISCAYNISCCALSFSIHHYNSGHGFGGCPLRANALPSFSF